MLKKIMAVMAAFTIALFFAVGCGETPPEKQAEELFRNGECEKAQGIYEELGMEKEAKACIYQIARDDLEHKEYKKAAEKLGSILGYEDAEELLKKAECGIAGEYFDNGDYKGACSLYEKLGMDEEVKECTYQAGKYYLEENEYAKAVKEFHEIQGFKDAGELLTNAKYKKAVDLYKSGRYGKAIAQFQKLKDYKKTPDYLEKCRVGQKYEYFDFQSCFPEETGQGNVRRDETVQRMESCMDILYGTWYCRDDSIEETSIVIDKYSMDGKSYCLLAYYGDPAAPEFDICYVGDQDDLHHISVLNDNTFYDVTDEILLAMSVDGQSYRNYDAMAGEYYSHLQEEAFEAAQPVHTKEEVYALAKQDVKDAVYGQMNFFDQVGYAVSISWDFEDIDTIQYSYDASAKVHTLGFSVYLSEYQGIGGRMSQRMMAQYYEGDDGGLIRMELARVE